MKIRHLLSILVLGLSLALPVGLGAAAPPLPEWEAAGGLPAEPPFSPAEVAFVPRDAVQAGGGVLASSPTLEGDEIVVANADCCNQTYPAVAYSSASDTYLVAWMDHNSDYPSEPERGQIMIQCVRGDGSVVHSSYPSPYVWDGKYNSAPDIAYDSTHNRFLVVWENHCTGRLYWDVSAVQVNASTCGFVGSVAYVVRGEDYHFRHPAVAFNSTDGEYLVVYELQYKTWTDDWDIGARRVIPHSDGSLDVVDYTYNHAGTRICLENEPETVPDVAYNAGINGFLVVWEYENTGGNPSLIQGRIVKDDGTLPGDITDIVDQTYDAERPAIAYNSAGPVDQFLVVYEFAGLNTHGQRVWSSYPTPAVAYTPFLIASSETETAPDVSYSPTCDCYVVTFHQKSSWTYIFYARRVHGGYNADGQLDGDALEVVEDELEWHGGRAFEKGRIACAPNSTQCLAVWQIWDAAREIKDISAQRIRCSGAYEVYLPAMLRNYQP